MVVICYASDIMGYDRKTPELSNAPLHMTQDTTRIENKTLKHRRILDSDLDLDLPSFSHRAKSLAAQMSTGSIRMASLDCTCISYGYVCVLCEV